MLHVGEGSTVQVFVILRKTVFVTDVSAASAAVIFTEVVETSVTNTLPQDCNNLDNVLSPTRSDSQGFKPFIFSFEIFVLSLGMTITPV